MVFVFAGFELDGGSLSRRGVYCNVLLPCIPALVVMEITPFGPWHHRKAEEIF